MRWRSTEDETFVLVRGKAAAHDDGRIVESVGVCFVGGWYGVSIPKGGWYTLEAIDENSGGLSVRRGRL